MDSIKYYNISIAKDNNEKASRSGFENKQITFKELAGYVTMGRMISSSTFRDGIRNKEHYAGNENILILDIDDGCVIDVARKIFKRYEFLIIPTKSHRKLKNGVMQGDRFRVFIPIAGVINTAEEHEAFYKNVMSLYTFVDQSCKDTARFFYGAEEYKHDEVIYNSGKRFPLLLMTHDVAKKAIIEKKKVIVPKKDLKPLDSSLWLKKDYEAFYYCEKYNQYINDMGDTIDFEGGELTNEHCFMGAKKILDDEYCDGNKARVAYKVAIMLKDDDIPHDAIMDFMIKEYDSRGGGKSFNQFMQILRSALKD